MPPASMSKLMTLDILFQRLKDGRVKLTDSFPVSERAWRTGGSKMFVKVGNSVPVEDLIRGIIIHSGNDACVVVAEALGRHGRRLRRHDEPARQAAWSQALALRQSERLAGASGPADVGA